MNIWTILISFFTGFAVMLIAQYIRNRTPRAQREEAAALGKIAQEKYRNRRSEYSPDDEFIRYESDVER